MLGPSLYIIVCSARNRLRVRLRRLREPRYLIGAVVGVAYIYFSFFARLRVTRSGRSRQRTGQVPASLIALSAVRGTAAGTVGIVLMAVAAAGWILPFDSSLLAFSPAEVQFLFPAPISRRALLLHRMIRSQLGLLFGAVVTGVAMPAATGYGRLRVAVAMWLLLSIGKVYFTGITLARSRVASRDARSRQVAWLPIAVLTTALAVVGAAIFREFSGQPITRFQDLFIRIGTVTSTGLSHVVLWPFVAAARPLFAPWPGPYLAALAGSLAVLAATVVWVLGSDAAFQEAAAEFADRKGREPNAQTPDYRVGPPLWRLAASGRPEAAFAWKAATQTLRLTNRRTLLRVASLLFALIVASASLGRGNSLAAVVGVFAFVAALFTVFFAPQVVRVDMRQDLRHLELLKTWPVRASAVVRGELLWPGAALTVVAWVAIAMSLLLSGSMPAAFSIGIGLRLAGGLAAAIVAPALVFAQLTIHNGVALMLPAWVPLGNQRPRGLDAMGQRLIMLGGTALLLILSALPGAIAGAIVWFVLSRLAGPAALVPAAAVFTAIVALEVLAASEALGPAYERLDMTAIESVE